MEAVEPFDFSQLVDYDPRYFAGFMGCKQDVDEMASRKRVERRICNTAIGLFRDSVRGYGANVAECKISVSNIKVKYALLNEHGIQRKESHLHRERPNGKAHRTDTDELGNGRFSFPCVIRHRSCHMLCLGVFSEGLILPLPVFAAMGRSLEWGAMNLNLLGRNNHSRDSDCAGSQHGALSSLRGTLATTWT
jgi:hypothetical protein